MEYTLGLDIGITSVGWAVLANDAQGEPYRIQDLGVRIFEAAEQPKTGASLAAPRREARSARRRLRRRRHRKERIRALLVQEGLISQDCLDTLFVNSGFAKDVYTLRAEGLDRLLDEEEWVRVLLHLTQRRGYHSNSTAQAKSDKETGVLKQALGKNIELMAKKGYRTVGEMFATDEKFRVVGQDGMIWRNTRNKSGNYNFTVTREMVRQEVAALFAAQRSFGNPHAVEALEGRYAEILFAQRHFDQGPGGDSPHRKGDMRGMCTFEPEERRAFKACYTFEYFKLLQDLNHIRLISAKGDSLPLSKEQRQTLIALCHKSPDLKYTRLRTALNLPESVTFNRIRYQQQQGESIQEMEERLEKKEKFTQLQSYHEIRKALNHADKALLPALLQEPNHTTLDEMATILSLYKEDEARRSRLEALGLSQPVIEALLPLSFSKAGNLSLTAMRKLIPQLEKGVTYDKACSAVYGDHRAHSGAQRYHTLTLNQTLRDSGALDNLTNPVVFRAISQTTKVLNAIIRKYGSPQTIAIELAREMRNNFQQRKKIQDSYEAHQKVNEKAMKQVAELKGSRPTGQDLVKYKLYEEQQGFCLYSGTQLEANRLFEPGYVDVDHIIPYSICFDDSYNNKVLVLTSENRQKGNHLPMEYLASDAKKRERFIAWAKCCIRNHRKLQRLLKETLTEEDCRGFKERNLKDTQYITTAVYNLLNDYLEFSPNAPKQPVRAVNGSITAHVRRRLGLEKHRENGDLHHAMDAAVVAVTTPGMIQRISNYAKRREMGRKVKGKYVDLDTGELMTQEAFDAKYAPHFPAPWPHFQQELLARLSPDPDTEIRALNFPHYDPQEVIAPVFVSQMPRRKATGPAHEDTIRSGKAPGYTISKTPLNELKLEEKTGEIENYYNPGDDRLLYEALKERLRQFGGIGKNAFEAPFHKPRKDGTPGPVVRSVKTIKKSNIGVSVNGGIAGNGSMVRIDVYRVPNDGYYYIPVYITDTVRGVLPQKACVQDKPPEQWKVMDDSHFLFSLYPGDLIRVERRTPIKLKPPKKAAEKSGISRNECLVYFVSADISTASICITTHDRKYIQKGLGVKRLSALEKYVVDPLGSYHKVQLPEKRQGF